MSSNLIYSAVLPALVDVERHHMLVDMFPGTYFITFELTEVVKGSLTMVCDDFGNLVVPRSVGYRG